MSTGGIEAITMDSCISVDLAPLLPWLAWGQAPHVGKDATKGNGWYLLA